MTFINKALTEQLLANGRAQRAAMDKGDTSLGEQADEEWNFAALENGRIRLSYIAPLVEPIIATGAQVGASAGIDSRSRILRERAYLDSDEATRRNP
jgi:hypothetical protein